MPVAGAHDAGAAAVFVNEPIERWPVDDERIHQHESGRHGDRPPGDALRPALFAAVLLGPFGVRRLEPPQALENLAD